MVPKRTRPRDLAGYLEAITRAVFQGGISWRVVDAKWDGIRDAFGGFDPEYVSQLDATDVDALMADPRLIRNRRKLEGTIDNAQTLLELDAEYGGFRRHLRSHGGLDETVADLGRQFRFVGDTGAHIVLYLVGEEAPHDSHQDTDHPSRDRRRLRDGGGRRRVRDVESDDQGVTKTRSG